MSPLVDGSEGMNDRRSGLAELAAVAARHRANSGAPTAIPRLAFWSAAAPTEPVPALFEAKFYLLLQGAKRLTIGGEALDFEAGRCAVSSVGLPFTSEVTEASLDAPYLGVEVRLDAGVITSLLLDMPNGPDRRPEPFSTMRIDESVVGPLSRLLRLLDEPGSIAVLAPQFERELLYRLLQGPMGGTLRQVGQRNTRFGQIRTAAEWICGNSDKPMCVSRLAASVGMSVTSFHRHFKAVTAHSPLAYQRQIRLLNARRRLASGAASVTATAFTAGYASTSQFSREYKRFFGAAPIHDLVVLRQ